MKNKNVEFVVTVDKCDNKRIIPIESFQKIFNVKTILRRKKSGSNPLPKKYYEDFCHEIEKEFTNYKIFIDKSRLYVKFNNNLLKSDCYLNSNIPGKKFFLSKKENNIYDSNNHRLFK
ncbi:MAG: hypothetical protein RSF67_06680 [Clostridia bacterium]